MTSRRPEESSISEREFLKRSRVNRNSVRSDSPSARPVTSSRLASARRDALVLVVLIGAVVLLIWNGSAFFRHLSIVGELGPEVRVASTALTLNVALILFGWRRYVDLQHEAELRVEQEHHAVILATTDTATGPYNRKGSGGRCAHPRPHSARRHRDGSCPQRTIRTAGLVRRRNGARAARPERDRTGYPLRTRPWPVPALFRAAGGSRHGRDRRLRDARPVEPSAVRDHRARRLHSHRGGDRGHWAPFGADHRGGAA